MSASPNEWLWGYEGQDPELEGQREALCTLGNGYVATRGRPRRPLLTGFIIRPPTERGV